MTSEDLTHRAAVRTGENIYIKEGRGSIKKKNPEIMDNLENK